LRGGGGVQEARKSFFRGRASGDASESHDDDALYPSSRPGDSCATAVPTRAHWDLRGSPPSPRRGRGEEKARGGLEKTAASCSVCHVADNEGFLRDKERQTQSPSLSRGVSVLESPRQRRISSCRRSSRPLAKGGHGRRSRKASPRSKRGHRFRPSRRRLALALNSSSSLPPCSPAGLRDHIG
jgi:hypothetical protein